MLIEMSNCCNRDKELQSPPEHYIVTLPQQLFSTLHRRYLCALTRLLVEVVT